MTKIRIDAVVRNFEVIGEAARNLSDDLKMQFPATDWKALAGFRDTLIHGYFGVDLEILRDIIVHKIPVLKRRSPLLSHARKRRAHKQNPLPWFIDLTPIPSEIHTPGLLMNPPQIRDRYGPGLPFRRVRFRNMCKKPP